MSKDDHRAKCASAEAALQEGMLNLTTVKHNDGKTSFAFTWNNVNKKRFHKDDILKEIRELAKNDWNISQAAIYMAEPVKGLQAYIDQHKVDRVGLGIPAKLILGFMEKKGTVWSVGYNKTYQSDKEPQIIFGKVEEKPKKGKRSTTQPSDISAYLNM